jgi:hypothetical protein
MPKLFRRAAVAPQACRLRPRALGNFERRHCRGWPGLSSAHLTVQLVRTIMFRPSTSLFVFGIRLVTH